MFIKKKKGSHAIETLIMVPIWLAVIVLCSYSLTVSKARQSLANESMAFANLAQKAESPEDALSKIRSYVSDNDLDSRFYSSGENSYVWFTEDIEGEKLLEGEKWSFSDTGYPYVYMWVVIHTAFTGVKSNSFKIGNDEIKVFPETYTNRILITTGE